MRFIIPTGLALAVSAAHAQPFSTQIIPPRAPIFAPAPHSDEPQFSLEQLLERALKNNPRLEIAAQNVEAAQNRAKSARALPNPTLQLVPALGGNHESRDEEIILAQPLDIFGVRRARAQAENAQTRVAQSQDQLAARRLKIEVTRAATALFAAQESEKLESAQLEIAEQLREAARKRAAVGEVPAIQIERAQLEVLRAQNELARAQTTRLTRRIALNLLIGAAPNAPLRIELALQTTDKALLSTDKALNSTDKALNSIDKALNSINKALLSTDKALLSTNKALPSTDKALPSVNSEFPATSAQVGGVLVAPDSSERPDLTGARASLDVLRAQERAAGRQRLPQIELQARHAPFLGRDGDSTSLRAVLTVPIFDFGAIKNARRAAQSQTRAQIATLQLLENQIAAQRESARVQLENQRAISARFNGELVPLALELLRKTQLGYAQGASTYLEVLDAQRNVRQLQSEYLASLIALENAQIALDAAQFGGELEAQTP